MNTIELAREVLEKAKLAVGLPWMMSPNILRPGIISIPLNKVYVALETEWDDGEYIVSACNRSPILAQAIIDQAEEIAQTQAKHDEYMNAITESHKVLKMAQEEIARLRARIVELEDGVGVMDNTIQELEANGGRR